MKDLRLHSFMSIICLRLKKTDVREALAEVYLSVFYAWKYI